MPLLIDQHTGSATYIETIHDVSFFIISADAVEFFFIELFCICYKQHPISLDVVINPWNYASASFAAMLGDEKQLAILTSFCKRYFWFYCSIGFCFFSRALIDSIGPIVAFTLPLIILKIFSIGMLIVFCELQCSQKLTSTNFSLSSKVNLSSFLCILYWCNVYYMWKCINIWSKTAFFGNSRYN